MTDPAREYGIQLPNGEIADLAPTLDRAENRLKPFRAAYPGTIIVERTITYGPWTPTEEQQ